MRCVRLRSSDPFLKNNPDLARWFKRQEPSLQSWEDGQESDYPSYDVRRRILTNSAVSCVDGFKAHTSLLFKFVFGVKLCSRCPFCTCADAEGRSNEIEGGAVGRMMTITGTYEFQKKKDEHVHMQCCIECPHSFYGLEEIASLIEQSSHFVDEYKQFVDGVCSQNYMNALSLIHI